MEKCYIPPQDLRLRAMLLFRKKSAHVVHEAWSASKHYSVRLEHPEDSTMALGSLECTIHMIGTHKYTTKITFVDL
jgi:hypothetical protein